MPELPETETIARDLDAALRGAVVDTVAVRRRDVLRIASARAFGARLSGARLVGVSRRAKSIVLAFDRDERVVITPRFTGTLLIDGAEAGSAPPTRVEEAAEGPDAYTCVTFTFADGRGLRYRDVRRLGTVTLLDATAYTDWDAALGPEPLDHALTAERFSGILRGSRRAVKSILMDQRRLAGNGNIYANEACWHAGVRPSRRGSALTRQECGVLLDALRTILPDAIRLRGTTFRDFRDAYGERGGYAARLKAYGRAGEPCARCGTSLRSSHAIDRRATVWCPSCQR
jgi:formamidopyrimidine-DNA glycosylase